MNEGTNEGTNDGTNEGTNEGTKEEVKLKTLKYSKIKLYTCCLICFSLFVSDNQDRTTNIDISNNNNYSNRSNNTATNNNRNNSNDVYSNNEKRFILTCVSLKQS